MKILIFGISNVGKTSAGKLLAEKMGYKFFDLDEEVKKDFQCTLEEFVNTEDLRWRDCERVRIIRKILHQNDDLVFSISPISYPYNLKECINKKNVLTIELVDTPENIFDRLVFSDENDFIYKDDKYKNARKEYYINEITLDLEWYGKVYKGIGITNIVDTKNALPEKVAQRIIDEFHLLKE